MVDIDAVRIVPDHIDLGTQSFKDRARDIPGRAVGTVKTDAQGFEGVENAPNYIPGNPVLVDCADFADAVHKASAVARSGDIVLMSPACAAFDQFKNFIERGKCFKKLVMEL